MITLEEHATELYDVIRTCTLCALSESRTNAVPGEGPLDAEVLFIGEAPGANEDKLGRPFVGAAGNFLTELIEAAGLKREDVYICNVLKCRPPNNRDPLPGEIEACNEYLELQIDMVDPLVIVTLGRFSMSRWFPQQVISRIHGTVREFDGRFVVPMYHPAAALHQGSLRKVLLDDFAGLPAIIQRARAARVGDIAPPTAAQPVPEAPPAPPEPAVEPDPEPISPPPPLAASLEPDSPAIAPSEPRPAPADESATHQGPDRAEPAVIEEPQQQRLFD